MARLDHDWAVTPREAVALQQTLRDQVRVEPLNFGTVRTLAGCDLSATRFRPEVFAGIVVLDATTLATVDEATAIKPAAFPYVPGLLSFREIPPLLDAWAKLTVRPDVVLFDGQGRAHPRRLGLASHAGLALDVPTVGCAKSRLYGQADEPPAEPGRWTPLVATDGSEEVLGAVLRTKAKVKPVYVSVGHRCTLDDAVQLVLQTGAGYRLPEPTRRAHELVNRVRRAHLAALP